MCDLIPPRVIFIKSLWILSILASAACGQLAWQPVTPYNTQLPIEDYSLDYAASATDVHPNGVFEREDGGFWQQGGGSGGPGSLDLLFAHWPEIACPPQTGNGSNSAVMFASTGVLQDGPVLLDPTGLIQTFAIDNPITQCAGNSALGPATASWFGGLHATLPPGLTTYLQAFFYEPTSGRWKCSPVLRAQS